MSFYLCNLDELEEERVSFMKKKQYEEESK